jgi:2-isopropylmalate synthase
LSKDTPWFVKGLWNASPINFSKTLRDAMPYLPERVYVRHAAREEEECGCVGFLMKDKIALCCATSDIGVDEIDMGYTPHPYQVAQLKAVREAFDATGRTTDLMIVTRGPSLEEYTNQIDVSVEAGADVVGIIGTGARDIPLLTEILDYAKENTPNKVKLFVCHTGITGETEEGLQERIKPMKEAVRIAKDKLKHIDIYDSRGIGTPLVNKYICETIKKEIGDVPLCWHGHNDFGNASSNALGAVEGGAEWLDLVVNGLGDRAGNSSLEEVVMSLKILYGIETGIKTDQLYQLSKMMERVSGVKVMWTKPVVGDFAWREDSHTAGILRARKAGEMWRMQPYNPILVGQRHRMVFGKTVTNPGTVKWLLDDMGLTYTEDDVERIVWAAMKAIDVRIMAGEDRFLLEHEIRDLCRQILIENAKLKERS